MRSFLAHVLESGARGGSVIRYAGDESEIVDDGAGRAVSISNLGSFGSVFTSSTTERRPYLASMGGRRCVRWLDDADQLSTLTDAGKTAAAFLHQPATNATVSILYRIEERADNALLFSTEALGSTGPGIALLVGASLSLFVGNGTIFDGALSAIGFGSLTVGDYVIQILKEGARFRVYLNGAQVLDATAVGLSSAATHIGDFQIGSGTQGIPGLMPELVIRKYAASPATLARDRAFLERWTLRAPRLSPTVWIRGDDPDAVISGGRYVSIPNRGSWGGTFTPDGGTGPIASAYGDRAAPFFTAGSSERLRCIRSPAAAFLALASMHLSGAAGTVAFVVDLGASGTLETLFSTQTSATALGVELTRTAADRLRLTVGTGASTVLDLNAGATTIASGRFVVAVRKTGLSYDVRVNGAAYASGSASSLSTTSAASKALEIAPTAGASFPELLAWNFRLDDYQIADEELAFDTDWPLPPTVAKSPAVLGFEHVFDGAGIVESGGSATGWNASIGGANLSKVGGGTLAYESAWRNGKPAITVAAGTRLENLSAPLYAGPVAGWTYVFVLQLPATHPTTAYGPTTAYSGKPFPVIFWNAGANVDVRTSPDGVTIHNTAPGQPILGKAVAVIVRVTANSQKITLVYDGESYGYATTGAAVHTASQGWSFGGWFGGGGDMTGGKIALAAVRGALLSDAEADSLALWALEEFAL